jgi:NAD(P)-dependent dehydrogenase (short-subunit alcohol dehydrogenase family)
VTVGPPLDLGSVASVRAFVSSLNGDSGGDSGGGSGGGGSGNGGGDGGRGARGRKQPRPLHVLVNNAGANYLPRGRTPEGVCTLAQASHFCAEWTSQQRCEPGSTQL